MNDILLREMFENQIIIMKILDQYLEFENNIHYDDKKKIMYELKERIYENGKLQIL